MWIVQMCAVLYSEHIAAKICLGRVAIFRMLLGFFKRKFYIYFYLFYLWLFRTIDSKNSAQSITIFQTVNLKSHYIQTI